MLAGALFLGGCGRGSDATPPADLARSALERSLEAWKNGGRPGEIAGGEVAIQAVDSLWLSGRKLESFQILREEGGEGDRRFMVTLSYPKPAKPQDARYVVLGQGPIWVYREEDYLRMINMDDNPTFQKGARTRR